MRRLGTGLIAAALVGALAACGGGSSGTAAAGPPDPNATFVFAFQNAVNSLDPVVNTASYGGAFLAPAYETLLKESADGAFSPGLATAWSFPDPKTFRMTIRQGVKFSDGTPLDAAAVVANINRGKTFPGSTVATPLKPIASATAVDPSTVELKLSAPFPALSEVLSDKAGMMVSPAAFGAPDLGTKPVGTGPFLLTEYHPQSNAIFQRNPNYWGAPAGVARVEVRVYTDTNAGMNALVSGQVDAFTLSTSTDFKMISGNLKRVDFPAATVEHLELNYDGKFADQRVRQAVSYAIDRNAIRDFAGFGTPVDQYAAPTSPLYSQQLAGAYPHDVAKAKQLLAEAGVPNLSFDLYFTARPYTQQLAQILQGQLRDAGITVNLKPSDGTALLNTCLAQRKCDSLVGNFTGSVALPGFVTALFTQNSKSGVAASAFGPVVQANAAVTSLDQTAQLQQLNQVLTEQVPNIPIRNVPYPVGMANKVTAMGWELHGYPDYASVKMSGSGS
jgi:ABC-type transport system substrate-binding protein